MKTQRWQMLTGWAVLGILSVMPSLAQAAALGALGPTTQVVSINGPVTLSIKNTAGTDIADTWFPNPSVDVPTITASSRGYQGKPVTLTFNNITNIQSVTLVTDPTRTPTTSSNPGTCTNYGLTATSPPSDIGQSASSVDFGLTWTSGTPATLTPLDCGGTAVIDLTATVNTTAGPVTATFTFVLPNDAKSFDPVSLQVVNTPNGIPDGWEAQFGYLTTRFGDDDGDNISNIDEYRGYIVQGKHVRGNPKVRDVFVHLVNPQCTRKNGTTDSWLVPNPNRTTGGAKGYPVDLNNNFAPATLFDNLDTLISAMQIHILDYVPGQANTNPPIEWQDLFVSFNYNNGEVWTFKNTAGATVVYPGQSPPDEDRVVTKNKLCPLPSAGSNPVPGQTCNHNKGIRMTECLNEDITSPVGSAKYGTPQNLGESILYTQRLINYINNTIGSQSVYLGRFVNGVASTPAISTKDVIISEMLKYYFAMEIGHTVSLTKEFYGATQTYHESATAGFNLDVSTNVVTSGSPKGVKFWIPQIYSAKQQGDYLLK